MATDDVNITEDAEMAECEGDKVVTMMDVLQEQQEFEEDANAVLGASDDKNCTYAKGHIKRQAIYACLTCCPDIKTDPTKRAGVCLACSLNCHENHELVELYTKRNFRCDCGNPKFNSHPCQFTPFKPDLNDDNIYNQNFSGLYCICQRPYPDPESTIEDDMIQCIICEDWLHASHLDAVVPPNDQYSEMICKGCMDKNEFLHSYSKFAVNLESADVDILSVNGDKPVDTLCNGEVAAEILTKGNVDNSTGTPNGDNVDMTEDKNKSEEKEDNAEESNAEILTSNAEPKSTELDNAKSTEDSAVLEGQTTQESQSVEVKETIEGAKEGESVEDKKESEQMEITSEGRTNSVDPDMITTDSASKDLVSEEQKDEATTVDEKASENNVDINKTHDNSDPSKTEADKVEDQLLDDIRALTSDNPSDEGAKADEGDREEKTAQVSENSAMEANDEEKQPDNSDIKEASIDEKANENLESNPVPVNETNNIEVPDTSQNKDSEMANADDKTDSVMDAIDELLMGPTETKESESKDNDQNTEETAANKDVEMSVTENKEEVPETTDTNTEKAESKSQDEPSENKVKEETADESVTTKTDDNEATDSTIITEPSSNENSAETESRTDLEETDTVLDTDKVNGDSSNDKEALDETDNNIENEGDSIKENDENKVLDESETANKRKLSVELAEETTPKKIKLDKCVRPKDNKTHYKGATFWPSNFRQKLCTCGECISMYKDLHVLFLTDPEDTVSAYESLGKENVDVGVSQYEKGMAALSSLDRIAQINALTEYNKMRDKLLDFLKSFKDRKEIVKEEDIKAFFAGMKPKREPDGVYFCR